MVNSSQFGLLDDHLDSLMLNSKMEEMLGMLVKILTVQNYAINVLESSYRMVVVIDVGVDGVVNGATEDDPDLVQVLVR